MPIKKLHGNRTGIYTLDGLPTLWLHALVQDHLRGKDLLSLFQVSKGMAAVVLQCAPITVLRLAPNSRTEARAQHAQRNAIEKLLAAAPGVNLHVHLDGKHAGDDVSTLWAGRVKQQVKQLSVYDMDMSSTMLQCQLKLQHCTQLQTLVIGRWCVGGWTAQHLEPLEVQRARLLPVSLTELHAKDWDSFCAAGLSRLLGSQLTHLTCQSFIEYDMQFLGQLTHVNMESLTDRAVECLAAAPNITHITVRAKVKFFWGHTRKQLNWQQLELQNGVWLDDLRQLPIHRIQQLVIHRCIYCKEMDACEVQHAIAYFARCPSLQCVPTVGRLAGCPEFAIYHHHPDAIIAMCANSMKVKGGIYLAGLKVAEVCQLMPCILFLPSNVVMLHVQIDKTARQFTVKLQRLMSALPRHVKQLVVNLDQCQARDKFAIATALVSHLARSQLPTRLVMECQAASTKLELLAAFYPKLLGLLQ